MEDMLENDLQELPTPMDEVVAQDNPPEKNDGNDSRNESKEEAETETSNPSNSEVSKDPTTEDPTTEDPTNEDATSKDGADIEEAAKDEAAEDATSKDEADIEEAAKDEASKDEAAKDEAANDGAANDGAANDGAAKDEAANDGAANDGAANGGAANDGAANDGAAKDGAANDGAAKDEAAKEGTAKDGAAKDEAAKEGTPKDGAAKDEAAKDGTADDDDWADIFGTGELKMKIVQQGKQHTKPQPSDMCDIRLVGKLENGKLVEKYDLLRVQIGDHEVVQGLELILPLMNVGEKALVIVAPRFGYGAHGNPPNIPPGATLKYAIELFNIEIQTPLENIPHDERMTLATAKRERGNWWYSRHDTNKAIQCYKKAADLLDETISYVDPKGRTIENTRAKKRIVVQEKIKVYNNLAATQLKMDAYDSAYESVLVVLKHEPNNVKALFRKAKILSAKGRVGDAIVPLRQACLLEPRNTAVLSELNRCMRILEIERRDERILCRKMFGHPDHSDEETAPMQELMPTEEKSLIWHKLLKTAVTATIMAAVAAALGYKFKNYPFL